MTALGSSIAPFPQSKAPLRPVPTRLFLTSHYAHLVSPSAIHTLYRVLGNFEYYKRRRGVKTFIPARLTTLEADFTPHAAPFRHLSRLMLKNAFLSGFVSLFYSLGTNPMEIWSQHCGAGMFACLLLYSQLFWALTNSWTDDSSIALVIDDIISSNVLQLSCRAEDLAQTFVRCPPSNAVPNTLAAKLPFISFQIRNVRWNFTL